MTRLTPVRMLVVLVALGALLAACGDDGGGNGSATGSPVGDGAAPVQLEGTVEDHGRGAVEDGAVEIEVDDFYFAPTFVEAEAGATVSVELFNEGDIGHTFTIESQGIDIALDPGQRETVDVAIDGEIVNYICTIHVSGGMQGALYTG
jgi:plastocyanin